MLRRRLSGHLLPAHQCTYGRDIFQLRPNPIWKKTACAITFSLGGMVALEMTDKKGVGCRCLVEGKNTPVFQKEEAVKPVKSWQNVLVPLLWEVEESLHEFKILIILKDEEIPLELLRAVRLGPEFASPRFPLYDNCLALYIYLCLKAQVDNAKQ